MLLALLLLAQTTSNELVLEHSIGVSYTMTEVESACGAHVVRIRFGYDGSRGRRGLVSSVRINDEEVPGAAVGLQERATNRSIYYIGVLNCGYDRQDPLFYSIMELSPLESQRDGLPADVWFQLRKVDGAWRITWDTRERP